MGNEVDEVCQGGQALSRAPETGFVNVPGYRWCLEIRGENQVEGGNELLAMLIAQPWWPLNVDAASAIAWR